MTDRRMQLETRRLVDEKTAELQQRVAELEEEVDGLNQKLTEAESEKAVGWEECKSLLGDQRRLEWVISQMHMYDLDVFQTVYGLWVVLRDDDYRMAEAKTWRDAIDEAMGKE